MPPSPLFVVLRKELKDTLRDRRTAVLTLSVAALSGPLILYLLFSLFAAQIEKARTVKLPVINAQHAPALIHHLQRQQIAIIPAPGDYEQKLKKGDLDVVLEIDADFAKDAKEGRSAHLKLYFDASRDAARPAIAEVQQQIRAFGRQWGELRLIARGIAPEVAAPLAIESVNLATPQQSGATILFMLAYYGLFAALMGGMATAIDSTAGERERQSLEPLLALPLSTHAIAGGKWLAVAAFNGLVVLVTILGFYLALQFLPLPKVGIPFVFGWPECWRFLLILFPLAIFYPALLLLLGSVGRTFKEAQTNASFVVTLIGLMPLVNIFQQGKEFAGVKLIPVTSQFLLLTKTMRGDLISLTDWATSAAIPLAATVACVLLLSRRLRRESILAGR